MRFYTAGAILSIVANRSAVNGLLLACVALRNFGMLRR